MEPVYVYRAQALRIIDGDTYVLRIDLGFRCFVDLEARLHGVNTPELSTDAGKQALAFVSELIGVGGELVVQSYRDKRSFARWVVDVWLPDGRDVASELVIAGHAVWL